MCDISGYNVHRFSWSREVSEDYSVWYDRTCSRLCHVDGMYLDIMTAYCDQILGAARSGPEIVLFDKLNSYTHYSRGLWKANLKYVLAGLNRALVAIIQRRPK